MEFDMNVAQLQMAYWNILLTAGPVLLVALCVGLLIGILQAATSINEATLSFVPKMGIVILTMALMSSFTLGVLSDYFADIFDTISTIN
ncbi:MAG: flagellar biosynthesis protein FliQ [Rhodobacteraceae bacterium]|nr:flagellar biosynthesis protein FliQ [Paracoccaceae bacterium]